MTNVKKAELGLDDEGNLKYSNSSGDRWRAFPGGDSASLLTSVTKVITNEEFLTCKTTEIVLLPAEEGVGFLPIGLSGLAGVGETSYVLSGGLNIIAGDFLVSGNLQSLELMVSIGPIDAKVSWDLWPTSNQAGTTIEGDVILRASVDDPHNGDFGLTVELFYLKFALTNG